MPRYQNVELEQLEPLRVLFGFFPTYRNSPLQPGFDRVLQVDPGPPPHPRRISSLTKTRICIIRQWT